MPSRASPVAWRADQVQSLDRRVQRAEKRERASKEVLDELVGKIMAIPEGWSSGASDANARFWGAFSLVRYPYRITLTLLISEHEIILLDIGSHDEVYRQGSLRSTVPPHGETAQPLQVLAYPPWAPRPLLCRQ